VKGAFSEGSVPSILRTLYVGRKSGMLHFMRDNEQRSVRFLKGNIVHAVSSAMGSSMGEVIVRDGLITRDQLKQADVLVTRHRRRLGQALLELGFIDRGRFEDALALHSREILLEVFSWEDGYFRFEEQSPDAPMEEDVTLKLSTGELILEAVRAVNSRQAIDQGLGNLDRVLMPSTDPLLRFQRVTLSPTDGFVLSRIEGTSTAREIIELVPVPAEEVKRSLFGLLCVGLVEYLPPLRKLTGEEEDERRSCEQLRKRILDAHAGVRTQTHYEFLGVAPTAAPEEIKAQYFRLAKVFHPDTHHSEDLADLRDQLEEVFSRLSASYDALSNPQRRAAYDAFLERSQKAVEAPPAPPPAQDAVARTLEDAEQLFAEGKYWEAIGLLQGGIAHAEGKTRTRMRVLRATALLKNPGREKDAAEELKAAVEENPNDVDAHYQLGLVFKRLGLKRRAAGHFRKAIEIRPRHREAQAELAGLEE
jgi:tetratricopeptide (TPR) repeat protein